MLPRKRSHSIQGSHSASHAVTLEPAIVSHLLLWASCSERLEWRAVCSVWDVEVRCHQAWHVLRLDGPDSSARLIRFCAKHFPERVRALVGPAVSKGFLSLGNPAIRSALAVFPNLTNIDLSAPVTAPSKISISISTRLGDTSLHHFLAQRREPFGGCLEPFPCSTSGLTQLTVPFDMLGIAEFILPHCTCLSTLVMNHPVHNPPSLIRVLPPSLTRLEFTTTIVGGYGFLVPRGSFSDDEVQQIISACPSLQVLKIMCSTDGLRKLVGETLGLPALRELEVGLSDNQTGVLSQKRKLDSFKLSKCDAVFNSFKLSLVAVRSDLQCLIVSNAGWGLPLETLTILPPKTELSLVTFPQGFRFDSMLDFNRVRELKLIMDCTVLPFSVFEGVCATGCRLVHLCLDPCPVDQSAFCALQQLPNLTHLILSHHRATFKSNALSEVGCFCGQQHDRFQALRHLTLNMFGPNVLCWFIQHASHTLADLAYHYQDSPHSAHQKAFWDPVAPMLKSALSMAALECAHLYRVALGNKGTLVWTRDGGGAANTETKAHWCGELRTQARVSISAALALLTTGETWG